MTSKVFSAASTYSEASHPYTKAASLQSTGHTVTASGLQDDIIKCKVHLLQISQCWHALLDKAEGAA